MPYFGYVLFGLGAICFGTFVLSFTFNKVKKLWIDLRYMV